MTKSQNTKNEQLTEQWKKGEKMIKEGMVILNTKHHPCVILKVDDRYCWLFAKTPKGYNCNHYGKWYIEDSIDRGRIKRSKWC